MVTWASYDDAYGPAGYVAALHLAAAIVSSVDRPRDAGDVRPQYAREIGVLRDLAERNLALAESDTEFVYALQALLAFENGGVWQRNLDSIAAGELSLQCPNCAEDLLLSLDEFTTGTWGDERPTTVEPGDARGSRMLELADRHGRREVAAQIPYLLGRTTCPACRREISIPTAVI